MHAKTPGDLWELRRGCTFLIERTAGLSAAEIKGDYEFSLAIERQLERIGETLRRIHDRDPEIARQLPNYRSAIDLRNIIAQQYYRLNWDRIRLILDGPIPALLQSVEVLLAAVPEEIE